MAPLTKDKQRQSLAGSVRQPLPVNAEAKIFVGALVSIDATGMAIAATTAAGTRVAGFARTGLDNTGGADGVLGAAPARFVVVERGVPYSIECQGSPLAGLPVYVVDDDTVTTVAGNVLAGYLVEPDPESSTRWFMVPAGAGIGGGGGAAVADITDSTGGTADGTLADVTASFNQAILNNNFADLAAKLNALLAELRTANVIAP